MIIRALQPNGVAITLGDPPHPSVRTYRIYQLGGTIKIPDDEADLFRSRIDGGVAAGLIEIVTDTAQARIDNGIQSSMQFFCTASEQVNHLIYVSGANTVERADASDSDTVLVIGYVLSKSATNVCRVTSDPGPVPSSGLTTGLPVYLSDVDPGTVTTTPPSAPSVLVEVGVALSPTTFFFTGAKVAA